MDRKELDELIERFKLVSKHIHYDEGVVLGSIVGQMATEIKRLNNWTDMCETCKNCDTRVRLKKCEGRPGDFTYCYRPVGSVDNICEKTIIPLNDLDMNNLAKVINDNVWAIEDTVELRDEWSGESKLVMGRFKSDNTTEQELYPVGRIIVRK